MNIQNFPKIDLHLHLDGSVSADTLIKIAKHDKVLLPSYDPMKLKDEISVADDNADLSSYLKKFDLPLRCLQTSYGLEYAAYMIVADAYKQNIKYLEVRFAPLLHIRNGLKGTDVVESVIKGLMRGEKEFGVIARSILICMRNHNINKNIYVIKLAKKYLNNGVVGVDLAGDESSFPPELFIEVFSHANDLGIPITIHAGEAGPNEYIWTAINKLHARRIGHGIRSINDENLMGTLAKRGIALELCPSSNLQTKAIRSLDEYPALAFFERKIPITINTDNTIVSSTTLSFEYAKSINLCGISLKILESILWYSLDAAFADDHTKKMLHIMISSELESFWTKYPEYKKNRGDGKSK